MEFKDYYKILGVEPDADLKTIKSAYRRLARKYHPDVSSDKDAEEKFKDVAEAYAALKDTEKRADYDELRKYGQHGQRFEAPPGWQPSSSGYTGEFSDFFDSIFGSVGPHTKPNGAQSYRQTHFSYRGQDIELELPILLEETFSDNKKTVSFKLPQYDQHGMRQADITKTLNVTIPKGVTEGERIRLKGQGGMGKGDGNNGDLYLHIRLVPHPLYDVEGHNLIITIPVSPWEAVLGAKIEVPTFTGNINLTIPANTQTGKRMRIKGKGLLTKLGAGDLYAVIKIVIPDADDKAHEQLWKNLSEQIKFDPRKEWVKT